MPFDDRIRRLLRGTFCNGGGGGMFCNDCLLYEGGGGRFVMGGRFATLQGQRFVTIWETLCNGGRFATMFAIFHTCVAFEGIVLLPAGIVLCNLILCYLCKMVYVISGTSATEEVSS